MLNMKTHCMSALTSSNIIILSWRTRLDQPLRLYQTASIKSSAANWL